MQKFSTYGQTREAFSRNVAPPAAGTAVAPVRRVLRRNSLHEDLTERIIGCGICVHTEFGAGLLESIYTPCFVIELRAAGLFVEEARRVPLFYKGQQLATTLTVDLIVENTVLVEVKAVESVARVHHAQVITYLKLTGVPVGLLMNFNVPVLKDGVHRLVHPDLYVRHIGSQ